MAAALTLAGVGTASAHGKGGGGGHCGPAQLKFSVDGGNWTTSDVISAAPNSIKVKLAGNPTEGCEYPVSLAAYKTDGPSWETSGTQVFLGVDQDTLSTTKSEVTLKVNGIDKTVCNGQVDLYGNNKVYDGKSGALPHYPDSYTPTNLIAHWNGSFDKCEQGGGGTTPPAGGDETTPPAGGDQTTPPAGGDETTPPAGGDQTTPPAGGDETTPPAGGGESTPPADSPSASPSSSAPAVADTAAPSGTPVAQPVSSTPTLAETGSNSSQTTTFVAAGAALVVIGAGAVVFTRRRNRTQA